MVEHRVDRPDADPAVLHRALEVDEEDRQPSRLVVELVVRRGACEEEHEIGVLRARDEDLLAIDDVPVASLDRGRLDPGRFRTRLGLSHAERLEPKVSFRERR